MKVGAPFNPYRVFQGVFAPYWVLEHKAISTGAKLCYIRLLGFAGKDARCYPSLEKLGTSLGVSSRQARDYVKGLRVMRRNEMGEAGRDPVMQPVR